MKLARTTFLAITNDFRRAGRTPQQASPLNLARIVNAPTSSNSTYCSVACLPSNAST